MKDCIQKRTIINIYKCYNCSGGDEMIYSIVDIETGEVLCQANDFSFICHVAIAYKKENPDLNIWIL